MGQTTDNSITITPYSPEGDWHWVEMHWSTKDSWELDKYSCPILDEVENQLPNVDAIPKKHMEKDLESLYDEFSKDGTADINLHKSISDASADNEKNNGIICTAVRQWIIIEVAFNKNDTPANFSKYPEIEVWAFLQPKDIGNKKSMKDNLGYVIDDFPRGGWYHSAIVHVEEESNGEYNPHLFILHNNMTTYTNLGKVEWKKITDESRSSRLHKTSSVSSTCERYLLKLQVIVRNIETPEDRKRKMEGVFEFLKFKRDNYFQPEFDKKLRELNPEIRSAPIEEEYQENDDNKNNDNGGEKERLPVEKLERLFKFETGSYLKVWCRNTHINWGNKNNPKPWDTDQFMENMHLLDCPEIKDPNGKRVDMTFILNYLLEKSKSEDGSLPKDWFWESPYGFFRPYSFKNHVWKRNRFSMDPEGKFEKDKWYYVGLWTPEVIHAIDNLEMSSIQKSKEANFEPSMASVPTMFGISITYMAILGLGYKLITHLKEKADNAPQPETNSGDGKKKKKAWEYLKDLLTSDDFSKLATIFACYGFPDKEEKEWFGSGEKCEKSFENMQKRYDADLKKNEGLVLFFSKFYKLLKTLTAGAIAALDPKETAAIINVIMTEDPASDSDFKKFDKSISILEKKITFEIGKGHYTKKLGGSVLPPPYLMWLAYAVSLKLTYGLEGEGEFSSLSEIKLKISPKGSAGIFVDLGAIWTMSKELGEAYTGKVDRVTDNNASNYGDKKDDHPFGGTLSEIFSYVDIQIGCGIKLAMEGNVTTQFDFSPGEQDKDGKKKDRVKFPDDEAPSFTISLNAPIYGKLSVLSKEFKALSCDLLFITPSAAAILPTGIYLGDIQLWEGADGLRKNFKNVEIQRKLINEKGVNEICIGEELKTTTNTKNIISKEHKILNKELPFFQTYLKEPNDPKIELETKSYYHGKSDNPDYNSKCLFKSKFTISQNKLLSKLDYSNAVKRILSNGYTNELQCCYAGDILQTARLGGNIKIKPIKITNFKFTNKKKLYKINDIVSLEFSVENSMQKELPLYIKVYESNIVVTGGNKEIKVKKDDKRDKGYFLCTQDSNTVNKYSCNVPLGELEKVDRFMKEWGNWDLCFKISLDFEGNYPIRFKESKKDFSDVIQFERKR